MTIDLGQLSDVSSTALLTLMGRVKGPLDDPEAARVAEALRPALAGSDVEMHRFLARGGVPSSLARMLCLRAAHFDDLARRFVAAHPDGLVVNLAAGLDTRFHRLGRAIEVVDVDLEPMIELKRRLLEPTDRYHLVVGSVTERDWLDAVPAGRPVIFLAEGLLMYLPEDEVRALLRDLAAACPGCELAAEVFQARWLTGWRGRAMQRRLRRSLRFESDATFQFGLRTSHDLEAWGDYTLLDDWSATDHLPGAFLWRRIPSIRHVQWVVHYRLGPAA